MYHIIKRITSYTKGDIYENRLVSIDIIAVKFGDELVRNELEKITERLNDSENSEDRNPYTVKYEMESTDGELRNLHIDTSDEEFAAIAIRETCHKEVFLFMDNELKTYHSRGKRLPEPKDGGGVCFKYLNDAITCLYLKCYNCRELMESKVREIVMDSICNGLIIDNDLYEKVYLPKKEYFDLMASEKNLKILR